jgi:hypothetical protein
LFFSSLFFETGVSTQGFALTKQSLYCLSHTSSPAIWVFMIMFNGVFFSIVATEGTKKTIVFDLKANDQLDLPKHVPAACSSLFPV